MPKKTIAENNYAFIDGNNLYLGAKSQDINLNYKRLRKYLYNKLGVTHAFLFIGFDPDRMAFYSFLQRCGFILIYKPTVKWTEQGKMFMKGNVDAELVLYAAAIEYKNYNRAVIISSDGDFACLINFLIKQKKLKQIITPTERYSSLLRRFSSFILPLSEIREKIQHK